MGYDDTTKGLEAKGRKYGRSYPGKINEDLVFKNFENIFHAIPDEEYAYLSIPLRSDALPGRDYILINQDCWNFLY